MKYEEFYEGLAEAIEEALVLDLEGDYNFDVCDAANNVIDYLERTGVMKFINEN